MAAAEPPPAAAPPGASRGLRGWLDSRTGYQALLAHLLSEPVRGGASWAYVFGSLLLFVLLNQALTGVLLMAFYAPSATDAWASVAYIQDQVRLGWFIRGMHSAGASVMVLGMLGHLLQVALYGAYRSPREVSWLSGLLLLLLTLGFALTGYLLPWDQKGYWATQVATSILGATPVIGQTLQTLLQGGPQYGNLTLTHFYALHVFVLPAIVVTLVVAHVALFRRHGVTPRWGRTDGELDRRTAPFWPGQALRDLLAAAALLALLAWWVGRTHGAELSAPADPGSRYEARPEWYFLPLYQLLKYFPGPLEIVAALGVPVLILGGLGAVPFLDRGRDPAPRRRLLPLGVVGGILAGLAALTALSLREDARNPRYRQGVQQAAEEAQRARHLALQGVPVAGGTAVYLNDPQERGRLLFREHCQGCHRLGSLGPELAEQKGPDLTRWGSRRWLGELITEPDSPSAFGHTKLAGSMKPVRLGPEPLADLVEYLYSLGGGRDVDAARVQRGATLFEDNNCDLCHERDGKTPGQGPGLGGYLSVAWTRALLTDPASPLYYGGKNDMTAFGKKLTAGELDSLAAYLQAQRQSR
jgi:ubiquinol-cytochrome c reductase cytochrome b subunit